MRSLKVKVDQKGVVNCLLYANRKKVILTTMQRLVAILVLGFATVFSSGLNAQSIYLGNDPFNEESCTCLNNSTTLFNGQFIELITIASSPGETWTITSIMGLYDFGSSAPPQVPTPIPVGTVLPEMTPGIYQFPAIHVDGLGFSVTFNNGVEDLSIGNTCFYPNPSILNFPDEICLSGVPVPLEIDVEGAMGTGFFTVDGNAATEFDPFVLGVGNHIIEYTFDAGTASANDPADPGCTTTIAKSVFVNDVPNTAIIAQINISLGYECEVTVTPEMVLAGPYPCLDDYYVVMYNAQGFPIGDVLTGEYLGQILNMQLFTYSGNYTGIGTVNVILGVEPVLDCPDDVATATIEKDVYLIQDTLVSTDPTIVAVNFACYADLVSTPPGIHNFHLDTFTVDQDGIYVFEGIGEFGKLAATIYEMEFDPANGPCNNIMASSQDIPLGEGYYPTEPDAVRINVQLHAGTQYILFTLPYDPGQLGAYEWAVWGMDGGGVVGLDSIPTVLQLPLFCKNYEDVVDNADSFEYFGYPDDSANCQALDLTFTDVMAVNGNCNPATITRTFHGVNMFGDEVECTQVISFDKIELDDLTMPPKNFTLSCDETYPLNDDDNPHPSVTGYPFILTAFGAQILNPVYCNMVASHADQERVYICGDNYQFIRRWLIIDNCISEVFIFNQLIRVGDFMGPIVDCTAPDNNLDGQPDTLYYSASPIDNTAFINVPYPPVSDNCSDLITVFTEVVTEQETPIYNAFGNIIGIDVETVVLATIEDDAPNRVVSGIPEGCHRFRYTATDECGNESVVECWFCVTDEIAPVAVCDDDLNMSIGGDGYGRIYAEDVDEGSNDNIGISSIEVRRLMIMEDDCSLIPIPYFTPWGPYVEFSCCDVGTIVQIDLRVTDLSGNINTCSTGVFVEDESNPYCVAPDDMTTTCQVIPYTYDGSDLAILQDNFGMPVGIDNCAIAQITELAPIINLDDCGYGTIIRRFQVVDQFGNISPNICEQEITIVVTKDYTVKFPKDYVTECAAPDADTLQLFSFGCEALTVTVTEEKYSVPSGACYKILRTYDIIDWCEYDGSSDPVILSRDEDCDGNLGDEDLWLIRRDGQIYLDRNNNENDAVPAIGTKSSICDGTTNPQGYWRTVASNGFWQYTQVIKVNDLTAPNVSFATPQAYCTDNIDCTGPVSQSFAVNEVCSSEDMTVMIFLDLNNDGPLDNNNITAQSLSGSYPNYTINGIFPMGNHAFDVHVEDGCGNLNIVKIPFTVVDCFAPTPICIDGLSTSLEQLPAGIDADGDGDIDAAAKVIFALNYVIGNGLDDCSGTTTYSIHLADLVTSGVDFPNPSQESLIVTCDEIGPQLVRIYSWDNAFNPYALQPDGSIGGPNYDYCETFIDVQDNLNHCTPMATTMGAISGHIVTEENEPVEGVYLGFNISLPDEMMTDGTGSYMIDSLELGAQYTLVPQMDYDYANGVSTLDVIFMAKHILGTAQLDSPYKIIAADINKSGSVTTIDMIQLRKLILGVSDEFPDNTSWRFIKAAHVFPNPADPWETLFPEALSISQLNGNAEDMDFIAVKIGDVNNSATTNLLGDVEERSVEGTFYVEIANDELRPGQEYRIDFNVGEDEAVQGMQFTLNFDREALELLYVENGVADDSNFGFQLSERGVITFSWEHPGGDVVEPGTNLFSLVFFAGKSARIGDLLSVNSSITQTEAYDRNYELLDLDLLFKDRDAEASGFELYQNIPNPFRNRTTIPFMLPEPSMATLTIYDVSGRTWKRIEGYYEEGHNQIHIDLSGLPIKGVLYYKLETSQYTATRKMILID
jgi:hypothetical protein